ncbi:hypothetical protein C8J57DRAFT_1232422 [Mycena rebaudengoi]|nr:hypothetical protein C8J57DRAFT_1232422 [Mycena rebaudengoi]
MLPAQSISPRSIGKLPQGGGIALIVLLCLFIIAVGTRNILRQKACAKHPPGKPRSQGEWGAHPTRIAEGVDTRYSGRMVEARYALTTWKLLSSSIIALLHILLVGGGNGKVLEASGGTHAAKSEKIG